METYSVLLELEIWSLGTDTVGQALSETCRGGSSLAPSSFSGGSQSLSFLGLWVYPFDLCLCSHMEFSLRVCLFSLLQGYQLD